MAIECNGVTKYKTAYCYIYTYSSYALILNSDLMVDNSNVVKEKE